MSSNNQEFFNNTNFIKKAKKIISIISIMFKHQTLAISDHSENICGLGIVRDFCVCGIWVPVRLIAVG